jgi:NTP pyrophosphatase (non-canonical NTP hydrolase)
VTATTLQGWYRHINAIYVDRNFYRSPESICCHLIEVCRGLSVAATQRRKRDLKPEEFLPKAIAWWLALCGRAGVPDVERMLWAKFPFACPYCRQCPHRGGVCKEANAPKMSIDWPAISAIREAGRDSKPQTLGSWQRMFNQIYPRDDSTNHETNITRLTEELGELCEAVRTLSVAPEYFVSEAPDVFAWLMGFANQFDFDKRRNLGQQLEEDMEHNYPKHCRVCLHQVCKCPPVHPDTLGRIAKEAPLDATIGGRLFSLQESIQLFKRSADDLEVAGKRIVPDHAELAKIQDDVGKLLAEVQGQTDWQTKALVALASALGGIERLAEQGEVTQGAVDDLRRTLEAMPSEKRSAILAFLNNLAASGTFQALAFGLQALSK